MSADNGVLVIKHGEVTYRVYEYSASQDYLDGIEGSKLPYSVFDTLKDAIVYGQSLQTEYGLIFEL